MTTQFLEVRHNDDDLLTLEMGESGTASFTSESQVHDVINRVKILVEGRDAENVSVGLNSAIDFFALNYRLDLMQLIFAGINRKLSGKFSDAMDKYSAKNVKMINVFRDYELVDNKEVLTEKGYLFFLVLRMR